VRSSLTVHETRCNFCSGVTDLPPGRVGVRHHIISVAPSSSIRSTCRKADPVAIYWAASEKESGVVLRTPTHTNVSTGDRIPRSRALCAAEQTGSMQQRCDAVVRRTREVRQRSISGRARWQRRGGGACRCSVLVLRCYLLTPLASPRLQWPMLSKSA